MPQLAPLHWLFLSLTFWFMIATTMALLWWSQHPQISPSSHKTSRFSAAPWKW